MECNGVLSLELKDWCLILMYRIVPDDGVSTIIPIDSVIKTYVCVKNSQTPLARSTNAYLTHILYVNDPEFESCWNAECNWPEEIHQKSSSYEIQIWNSPSDCMSSWWLFLRHCRNPGSSHGIVDGIVVWREKYIESKTRAPPMRFRFETTWVTAWVLGDYFWGIAETRDRAMGLLMGLLFGGKNI